MYLRHHACRRSLRWKTISTEAFKRAQRKGEAEELFKPQLPGVIAFDDFTPEMLEANRDTFLAGLDGIDCHREVVYLFTSNSHLKHFNPAFQRPGRIDHTIEFPKPDAELRRKFMGRWHPDIREGIDLARAIDDTDGTSFAALEQVKALLVSRYVEARRWEWSWAWETFCGNHDESASRPVGFHVAGRGNGRIRAGGE